MSTTTVKLEGPEAARLRAAKKKTKLSMGDLLRLALDSGLPRIVSNIERLREGGVGGGEVVGLAVAMSPEQLGEIRELYKSAVTDLVDDVAHLTGKDFVAMVGQRLATMQYGAADEARVRRFLAIYAQLF